MAKKIKICGIGGGSGVSSLLLALKVLQMRLVNSFELDISVVVTVHDSGGPAIQEKYIWNTISWSDIRKALCAIAPPSLLRYLMTYRFEEGVGMAGLRMLDLFLHALRDHPEYQSDAACVDQLFDFTRDPTLRKIVNFEFSSGIGVANVCLGNLIMYALSHEHSVIETVRIMGEHLRTPARIIPINERPSHLILQYEGPFDIVGEAELDNVERLIHEMGTEPRDVENFMMLPRQSATPEALEALGTCDIRIFAMGDPYGSLLINTCAGGVIEVLATPKDGKVGPFNVLMCNLMTKFPQTLGFAVGDHVKLVESVSGAYLDAVLVNSTPVPTEIYTEYAQELAEPVDHNSEDVRVFARPLIDPQKINGDKSSLRHDPELTAVALEEVLRKMGLI